MKNVFLLQIHKKKYAFNQRVLSLRENKIKQIDKISELVEKLESVQKVLEEDEIVQLPRVPHMYPDELPEKYVKVLLFC